jgi:uncharacterized membrane protein
MRTLPSLILVILLLALPAALADRQEVDVTLHGNGVVEQRIVLDIMANASYETLEYFSESVPIAITTDVSYDRYDSDNGTRVVLYQPLTLGPNRVEFSLLFDNAVVSKGRIQFYAVGFRPERDTDLSVIVRLPEGAVLAAATPAVSPKPDDITTDGRTLVLSWTRPDPASLDLIVLYEQQAQASSYVLAGAIVLLVLVVVAIFTFRRRRQTGKAALAGTLSDDERRLIGLIGKGVTLQKELIKETGFSKSKMSKVMRRLEEKGAVRKEPFNKTNRFELNNAWR